MARTQAAERARYRKKPLFRRFGQKRSYTGGFQFCQVIRGFIFQSAGQAEPMFCCEIRVWGKPLFRFQITVKKMEEFCLWFLQDKVTRLGTEHKIKQVTKEQQDAIIEDYMFNGRTVRELAHQYGIKKPTYLSACLQKLGVPTMKKRKKGGKKWVSFVR